MKFNSIMHLLTKDNPNEAIGSMIKFQKDSRTYNLSFCLGGRFLTP